MGISPETLFERSLAKMVAAPVALSLLIILAQWPTDGKMASLSSSPASLPPFTVNSVAFYDSLTGMGCGDGLALWMMHIPAPVAGPCPLLLVLVVGPLFEIQSRKFSPVP